MQKFSGKIIVISIADHKFNLVVRIKILKIVMIETALFTTAGTFDIHHAATSAVNPANI